MLLWNVYVIAGNHFDGGDVDTRLRGRHCLQVDTSQHRTSRPRRRMTH